MFGFPVDRYSCLVACLSCTPQCTVKQRAEEGDVSEADEELLCKLTVWVDLPVWYPEQVAQAVSSSSGFLHRRSAKGLLVPAVHCFGFEPWRLVEMVLTEYRHTPLLSKACVGYGSWHLCFNKVGTVPFFPLILKRRCRFRGGTLHSLQECSRGCARTAPADQVVKGVTSVQRRCSYANRGV